MLKNLQGYTNFGLKIGNTRVWPNCLFVVEKIHHHRNDGKNTIQRSLS